MAQTRKLSRGRGRPKKTNNPNGRPVLNPEPIVRDPGNLVDNQFTEDEMKVIYYFCDFGNKRTSYRKFLGDDISDTSIYKWFNRADVQAKILEVGQSLSVYDTVCDKTLLNIITDLSAQDKDKIQAIKVWNDLRKRTHQTIQLQHTGNIDLSNVTDENLESIVNNILKVDEEIIDN